MNCWKKLKQKEQERKSQEAGEKKSPEAFDPEAEKEKIYNRANERREKNFLISAKKSLKREVRP